MEIASQMTLFQEKTKEEKLIARVLFEGSGFVDGKQRIYKMFFSELTKAERIKAIADEYGTGGVSYVDSYFQWHSSKGMEIKDKEMKITLTWTQIEEKIGNLIAQDKYLD